MISISQTCFQWFETAAVVRRRINAHTLYLKKQKVRFDPQGVRLRFYAPAGEWQFYKMGQVASGCCDKRNDEDFKRGQAGLFKFFLACTTIRAQ